MKSILKFIIVLTGITTITSYLLKFNFSDDIAKDIGTMTEQGIRNTINTVSDIKDTISLKINFPQIDTVIFYDYKQ